MGHAGTWRTPIHSRAGLQAGRNAPTTAGSTSDGDSPIHLARSTIRTPAQRRRVLASPESTPGSGGPSSNSAAAHASPPATRSAATPASQSRRPRSPPLVQASPNASGQLSTPTRDTPSPRTAPRTLPCTAPAPGSSSSDEDAGAMRFVRSVKATARRRKLLVDDDEEDGHASPSPSQTITALTAALQRLQASPTLAGLSPTRRALLLASPSPSPRPTTTRANANPAALTAAAAAPIRRPLGTRRAGVDPDPLTAVTPRSHSRRPSVSPPASSSASPNAGLSASASASLIQSFANLQLLRPNVPPASKPPPPPFRATTLIDTASLTSPPTTPLRRRGAPVPRTSPIVIDLSSPTSSSPSPSPTPRTRPLIRTPSVPTAATATTTPPLRGLIQTVSTWLNPTPSSPRAGGHIDGSGSGSSSSGCSTPTILSPTRQVDAYTMAGSSSGSGSDASDRGSPVTPRAPPTSVLRGRINTGGPGASGATAVRRPAAPTLPTSTPKTPATARAPPKTPMTKASPTRALFIKTREATSRQLYAQWNASVFGGRLPPDLPLVWNPRLLSSAGQVVDDGSANARKTSHDQRIPVRLDLSPKVLDCLDRLRCTLAHEMCHVAAWVIDKEYKSPHGVVFRQWGDVVERLLGIQVTTRHTYEVHIPHRWTCAKLGCGRVYKRHRKTIAENNVCGDPCMQGQADLHGQPHLVRRKFDRHNVRMDTPVLNAYNVFVKDRYAGVAAKKPPGTPMRTIMAELNLQWKVAKDTTNTTNTAGASTPTPLPTTHTASPLLRPSLPIPNLTRRTPSTTTPSPISSPLASPSRARASRSPRQAAAAAYDLSPSKAGVCDLTESLAAAVAAVRMVDLLSPGSSSSTHDALSQSHSQAAAVMAAAAAAAVAAAAAAVGIDLTSPPVSSSSTRHSPLKAAGTNLLSLLLQLSPPALPPLHLPAQRSEPPSPVHPAASPLLLSLSTEHASPPTASQPHQHCHLSPISIGSGSSGASSGNSTPGCSPAQFAHFQTRQSEAMITGKLAVPSVLFRRILPQQIKINPVSAAQTAVAGLSCRHRHLAQATAVVGTVANSAAMAAGAELAA
ncbi:MAG: hypothetical protein WDW38_010753 [Sanguina aurantia]